MKDKEIEKFLQVKEDVLNRLEDIRFGIIECEDKGMEDLDSVLYNEMLNLIQEAETIDNYEELSMIIIRAQAIEKNIDTWIANQGGDTLNINWPEF